MLERLLPIGSSRRSFVKRLFVGVRVPRRIRRNFRPLDAAGLTALEKSLREHFFAAHAAGYLETDRGRRDLDEHLRTRLDEIRRYVIPWLDSVRPLEALSVLEVGCGTGPLTLALAEQGAAVAAVDIKEASLAVAADRLDAHGLSADFARANATELAAAFPQRRFEMVVFFASLEHMTYAERLAALADAWKLLPSGGLLVVADTPNRLWHTDLHSSLLPFFHWLPDELAFEYSRFSPNENYSGAYRPGEKDTATAMLRLGRGMSFHEIELATHRRAGELKVASSKAAFQRRRCPLLWLAWLLSRDRRYESLLAAAARGIGRGFLEPFLDVIIEKS